MKEDLFYSRNRKSENYTIDELKTLIWRYFLKLLEQSSDLFVDWWSTARSEATPLLYSAERCCITTTLARPHLNQYPLRYAPWILVQMEKLKLFEKIVQSDIDKISCI